MVFNDSFCEIQTATGNVIVRGTKQGNLYLLAGELVRQETEEYANVASTDRNLWHSRLGHVGDNTLDKLARGESVTGIKVKDGQISEFCDGCAKGKAHRVPPRPLDRIRAKRRLEIIYSDVCGPVNVSSLTGQRYLITFTDDYSCCSQTLFKKQKSEALEKFKQYRASAEGSSGEKIGSLHTDRGGEYTSDEFERYLIQQKINHEEMCAHSPKQNGVAERLNRNLMEKACVIVTHAGLKKSFWAEAVATPNYLKNRMPTKTLGKKTPYELWYERKPDISHLKGFGCIAHVHVPDVHRRKFDDKSEKMRFMGYSKGGRGYRLLNEETMQVTYRRDVRFDENCFTYNPSRTDSVTLRVQDQQAETPTDTCEEAVGECEEPEEEPEVPVLDERADPLPHAQRPRVQPKCYGIDEIYLAEMPVVHSAFSAVSVPEPTSMKEAMTSEHRTQWKCAVQEEYDSLLEHETWRLCDLPSVR